MIKYWELKQSQSEEFEAFSKENIIFAFNKEQLEEELPKFKGKPFEEIGFGGFILKEKVEEYGKMFDKWETSFKEKMLEREFAIDAFRCELSNHEYCVTYDAEDALNSLGYSYEDIKNSPHLESCLVEARTQYLKWYEEEG